MRDHKVCLPGLQGSQEPQPGDGPEGPYNMQRHLPRVCADRLKRNQLTDTAMARGMSNVCIQPADSKCCKECSLHHLPPFIT